MKRIPVLIIFSIIASLGFTQELVFNADVEIAKENYVNPVFFFNEHELAFLIQKKKNLEILMLDDSLQVSRRIQLEVSYSDFPDYIGAFSNGTNRVLFLKNRSGSVIVSISINSETFDVSKKETDLLHKGERLVAFFSQDNTPVVVSSDINDPIIYTYQFINGEEYIKKPFSFEGVDYSDGRRSFKMNKFLDPDFFAVKIESKTRTGMMDAAHVTKLYLQNNKVIISFDHFSTKTKILTLDLENGTASEKDYYYKSPMSTGVEKGNSFVYGDNLYQLVFGDKHWELSQVDLESGNHLSDKSFSKNSLSDYTNAETAFMNIGVQELINYKPVMQKHLPKKFDEISKMNPLVFVMAKENEKLELIIGGSGNKGALVSNTAAELGIFPNEFFSESISAVFNSDTFNPLPGKSLFQPDSEILADITIYLTKIKNKGYIIENGKKNKFFFMYEVNPFKFLDEYYFGYFFFKKSDFYFFKYQDH